MKYIETHKNLKRSTSTCVNHQQRKLKKKDWFWILARTQEL